LRAEIKVVVSALTVTPEYAGAEYTGDVEKPTLASPGTEELFIFLMSVNPV
jgi:hypothetical protein